MGSVLINNNSVNSETELELNSSLITDENSSVRIIIPQIGDIQVEPNSSLSRTRNDFEIKLSKGKIIKKIRCANGRSHINYHY